MARILLNICYLGHAFHGWQKQANGLPTIQAALETAVSTIAGHQVEVIAAGRTDRGVHALNLTAHFDTTSQRSLNAWVAGVNTHLPPDIAVLSAQEVPSDFHARFNACRREYRYVLSNAPVRPVILKGKVGWTFVPVSIEKMQQAAQLLLGEQDFSSFRSSECQAKSPVKTMYSVTIFAKNDFICFDFAASGFLHHQVRNMVGALLYVGSGKITQDDFAQIIAAKNRQKAPPTFMADGLYLTKVGYPPEWGIVEQSIPKWFFGE